MELQSFPPTKLSPGTHPGHVHLTVSNLTRELVFYQQQLGMQVRHMDGGTARLGTEDRTLLVLSEYADAPFARGAAGLYHFAIQLPTRADLADFADHLIQNQTPVQGASDHLVSEAIYLSDPEGNGIEVYADRPRDRWIYTPGGALKMDTLPLDLEGLLREKQTSPFASLPEDTRMGHVHLHVSEIAESVVFYRDVLGMEITALLGNSAGFASAGGYHHHLGFNTWQGVGAPPPPIDSAGLRYFSLQVPDINDLDLLIERMQAADTAYWPVEGAIFLRDPSQNGVLVSLENPASNDEFVLQNSGDLLIRADLLV